MSEALNLVAVGGVFLLTLLLHWCINKFHYFQYFQISSANWVIVDLDNGLFVRFNSQEPTKR